jgi:hypothetical protein
MRRGGPPRTAASALAALLVAAALLVFAAAVALALGAASRARAAAAAAAAAAQGAAGESNGGGDGGGGGRRLAQFGPLFGGGNRAGTARASEVLNALYLAALELTKGARVQPPAVCCFPATAAPGARRSLNHAFHSGW